MNIVFTRSLHTAFYPVTLIYVLSRTQPSRASENYSK